MATNLPKTNFPLLEKEFEEIIEIRDGANGLPSGAGAIRKTIIFSDFQKISCQEFLKNGLIDYYHYDYYDANGNIIMKFHSEEHPHNPEIKQMHNYPYHLHIRENEMDIKANKRISTPDALNIKELYSIVEFILLSKQVYAPILNVASGSHTKNRRRKSN